MGSGAAARCTSHLRRPRLTRGLWKVERGHKRSPAHCKIMLDSKPFTLHSPAFRLCSIFLPLFFVAIAPPLQAQTAATPTAASSASLPQTASIIEREQARLRSDSVEERIDAVLRLGALARPDAARAAALALEDSSPRVRAVATRALRALPATEAARLLLGLLDDRDEFVRQEAAYALGEIDFDVTMESAAKGSVVTGLLAALDEDGNAGVRGTAAVSLGRTGDRRAVPGLLESLSRRRRAGGFFNRLRRRRTDENEFVRRSAIRSLGLIGDRQAVPALIATLEDEDTEPDVRREAARALGTLGDARAIPALRSAERAPDALLSRIAFESLVALNAANPGATIQPTR